MQAGLSLVGKALDGSGLVYTKLDISVRRRVDNHRAPSRVHLLCGQLRVRAHACTCVLLGSP